MSLVHMVEINGKRHDITFAEVTEEHRCDGCGEFIADKDRYVVDAVITTPDDRNVEIGMDFHVEHIDQAGQAILKATSNVPPF